MPGSDAASEIVSEERGDGWRGGILAKANADGAQRIRALD